MDYHPLLLQESIILPLRNLIQTLSLPNASLTEEEERFFNVLLNTICRKIVDEASLLPLFFAPKPGARADAFPVFSALVPLALKPSAHSMLARNSLLLCMGLTADNTELSRFVATQSPFCSSLADELQGLFAVIPSVPPTGRKFSKLSISEVGTIPGVEAFLYLLDFCNDIVYTASLDVASKVCGQISERLLQGKFAESIKRADQAACISTTAVLDWSLQHVSAPLLVRHFLKFTLDLKGVLIERINAKGELCMVTLRLFLTLLSLGCEDIMLELCLRPLLAKEHIQDTLAVSVGSIGSGMGGGSGNKITPTSGQGGVSGKINGSSDSGSANSGKQQGIASHFARTGAVANAVWSKAFLTLSLSKPSLSPYFAVSDYVADAQRALREGLGACSHWVHVYTLALGEKMDTKPSSGLSGEGFYKASGGWKDLFRRSSSSNAKSQPESLVCEKEGGKRGRGAGRI